MNIIFYTFENFGVNEGVARLFVHVGYKSSVYKDACSENGIAYNIQVCPFCRD